MLLPWVLITNLLWGTCLFWVFTPFPPTCILWHSCSHLFDTCHLLQEGLLWFRLDSCLSTPTNLQTMLVQRFLSVYTCFFILWNAWWQVYQKKLKNSDFQSKHNRKANKIIIIHNIPALRNKRTSMVFVLAWGHSITETLNSYSIS